MIRPMTRADLDAVVELENLSFPEEAWSRESFEFELNGNKFSRPVVLEQNGQITAYAVFWLLFDQAQLASIAVHPDFRGRSLGGQLLDYAIAQAAAEKCSIFTLEVRPSNTAAQKLYESRGFVLFHRTRRYYSNGEDALVMGLGL